jgi:Uma2 family endonuclease
MVAQAYEPHERFYTPQEYLELEETAKYKSEYLNGHIYAMAGASANHVRLTSNVNGLLHAQLRGHSCEIMGSDMRVKVDATGLYTYPDALVVCDPQFDEANANTLLNPCAIVEVLSPSTQAYDRSEKWEHYQHLASLRDYVLIEQDRMRVEHFSRQEDGAWLFRVYETSEQEIVLSCTDSRLKLGDIYERVTFNLTEQSRSRAPLPQGAMASQSTSSTENTED